MFRDSEPMRTATILSWTLLLSLVVQQGFAEANESEAGGSTSEERVRSAPAPRSTLSKLTVHGYLTQAYAVASFLESPENLPEGLVVFSPTALETTQGIPEAGTTDYRNLALQFRYDATPLDVIVIQLSNEAVGFSPVSEMKDDVELDWAYYERIFKDQLRIKVGRIPIPKGIYNAIRDAGTFLPFYHPPWSVYLDGVFASESVDGLALYNTFFPEANWSLEAAAWGGSYDIIGGDTNNPSSFVKAKADNAFGLQLWVNTPHPGVRFGFSSLTADLGNAGFFQGLQMDSQILSVEATFSRLAVRSEFMHDVWDFLVPFGPLAMNFHNYYAQVGYLATDKFQIWVQYDAMTNVHEADFVTGGERERAKLRETRGISFIYQFMPNLVLRAEHNLVRETQAYFYPIFEPGGFTLGRLLVHLDHGDYSMVSLSVSF
ncbi:MAG: hypothetical protein GY856_55145 [bacterium]|nr:hypothetical protein [bacterium]